MNNGFHATNELYEAVRAIRNRCDAILSLRLVDNIEHVLPTLLEDMHEDSQMIMDDYCIERADD